MTAGKGAVYQASPLQIAVNGHTYLIPTQNLAWWAVWVDLGLHSCKYLWAQPSHIITLKCCPKIRFRQAYISDDFFVSILHPLKGMDHLVISACSVFATLVSQPAGRSARYSANTRKQ